MIPEDLKFTKTHEWARVDGDVAAVGITEFAIQQLGDMVFLELPAVGETVSKGSPFGVIESVKAAVDLESPLSGEVIETNEALIDKLESIEEDAYGKSWMIKIKASDLGELESMMSPSQYEAYIQSPEAQN